MGNQLETRDNLLTDISALEFMLTDLNLYLDTHPYDTGAIMLYNNIKQQADARKYQYMGQYGALTPSTTSNEKWNWIDSPWPWEMKRGEK